jgi:hypothetical protein
MFSYINAYHVYNAHVCMYIKNVYISIMLIIDETHTHLQSAAEKTHVAEAKQVNDDGSKLGMVFCLHRLVTP